MIQLKRVYERESPEDGTRFLVDRLWPRGVSKSDLHFENWLKEAGPSTALRRWFGHDPGKWDEFCRKYSIELDSAPGAWEPVMAAARRGTVTLLYSSQDTEHNNAVALKQYIERKLRKKEKPGHKPAA